MTARIGSVETARLAPRHAGAVASSASATSSSVTREPCAARSLMNVPVFRQIWSRHAAKNGSSVAGLAAACARASAAGVVLVLATPCPVCPSRPHHRREPPCRWREMDRNRGKPLPMNVIGQYNCVFLLCIGIAAPGFFWVLWYLRQNKCTTQRLRRAIGRPRFLRERIR